MRTILRGSGGTDARGPLRRDLSCSGRQRNPNTEKQDCTNRKRLSHACSFVKIRQNAVCRTWLHIQ